MKTADYQVDHRTCLEVAARLLDGPVRSFDLDDDVEYQLRRHMVLEAREGTVAGQPMMNFTAQRRGHNLRWGVERYRISVGSENVRAVKVVAPYEYRSPASCYVFWAVAEADYRRLYKLVRSVVRKRHAHPAPVMRPEDRNRLWDNTIGFLRHDTSALAQYGLPQRRGVLLLGQPGNGKTMVCRWLRSQCQRYGLYWNSVTADEYQTAMNASSGAELFSLWRPGIVFFDDVDMALRHRDRFGSTTESAVLLGALDGIDVEHGVVYVFTSNAELDDIDPAFRRPGRIDLVLEFELPDAALRRELITETWQPQIIAAVDVDHVVSATEGMSFAELEEIRRIMVLAFLATGRWDWDPAWRTFVESRGTSPSQPAIGFAAQANLEAELQLPREFPFAPRTQADCTDHLPKDLG